MTDSPSSGHYREGGDASVRINDGLEVRRQ